MPQAAWLRLQDRQQPHGVKAAGTSSIAVARRMVCHPTKFHDEVETGVELIHRSRWSGSREDGDVRRELADRSQ